ncbi:MAG: hypothetical protein ACRCX2_10795 [Paraclostridium sp.]
MKLTIVTLLTLGTILNPIEVQAPINNIPYETIEEVEPEIIKDPYEKELDILRLKTGLNVVGYKLTEFKNTYYTSLPSENGGWTVTCNGEPLEGDIVANNTLPQGTKLYFNGKVYTVADRGSSRFNNPNRLDVLVERNYGESDGEYLTRVNNLGVDYIPGLILEIE